MDQLSIDFQIETLRFRYI